MTGRQKKLRGDIAANRAAVQPRSSLRVVLRHAAALHVHRGESGFGRCESLISRSAQPSRSRCIALRHAPTLVVHDTESALGVCKSLSRGLAKPYYCVRVTLKNTPPLVGQPAQSRLRNSVPRTCSSLKTLDRQGKVLTSAETIFMSFPHQNLCLWPPAVSGLLPYLQPSGGCNLQKGASVALLSYRTPKICPMEINNLDFLRDLRRNTLALGNRHRLEVHVPRIGRRRLNLR